VFEDLVEAGWRVSKNTVATSMARQASGQLPETEAAVVDPPGQGRRADPGPDPADFHAEAVDRLWCGDLTEIPTDEGTLYLATVLDLASRRLPGFAMSEH